MLQIRGIITLKNQEASSLMKIFNGMNEELDKCTYKVKAKVADNWTIVNTMQLTTSNRNKMSCDVYSCLSSCRKSDTAFDPKEVNYIVKSQFAIQTAWGRHHTTSKGVHIQLFAHSHLNLEA
jgi:hypothetical protein